MKRNFHFSIFNFQFKQKGFTLIELLIVIAIIGILSTVLMVNFIGIRERARDARRKSDLRQIQQALELYRADQGAYPATDKIQGKCGSALTDDSGNTTYMSSIPQDPDPSKGCYNYKNPGDSNAPYTLWVCLENSSDNDQHNIPGSYCGVNYPTFTLSADQ